MITGYFGVPGCGKTTFLTMIAQKELRKIEKGKSPFKHVLTNFYCEGCDKYEFKDLGNYAIEECLILCDEITLYCDSRDFKKFTQKQKDFFTLHRHVKVNFIYFCQDFSRVDKTIRELTFDLWTITSSVFPLLRNFSFAKRIWRNVTINEYVGDLILGYRFSNLRERWFTNTRKTCYRPHWYKYFDTFDKGSLAELPEFNYIPWEEENGETLSKGVPESATDRHSQRLPTKTAFAEATQNKKIKSITTTAQNQRLTTHSAEGAEPQTLRFT